MLGSQTSGPFVRFRITRVACETTAVYSDPTSRGLAYYYMYYYYYYHMYYYYYYCYY